MTTMELLGTTLAVIVLIAITAFIVIAAVRTWNIGANSENQDEMITHFAGYFDKFGNPVKEGDIVSDGEYTYSVYYNADRYQIDAYSTTGGLIQNLSPREAAKLEIVGRTLEMEDSGLWGLYTGQDLRGIDSTKFC